MATYTRISIDSGRYVDSDDCLADAAADYAREHGLEPWQVTATWEGGADGQRDRIALEVPSR